SALPLSLSHPLRPADSSGATRARHEHTIIAQPPPRQHQSLIARRKKCHQPETDLDEMAVRQPENSQVNEDRHVTGDETLQRCRVSRLSFMKRGEAGRMRAFSERRPTTPAIAACLRTSGGGCGSVRPSRVLMPRL